MDMSQLIIVDPRKIAGLLRFGKTMIVKFAKKNQAGFRLHDQRSGEEMVRCLESNRGNKHSKGEMQYSQSCGFDDISRKVQEYVTCHESMVWGCENGAH